MERFIRVDDCYRHDGLFQGDFLLLSENSRIIDDILHSREVNLDAIIEQLFFGLRDA